MFDLETLYSRNADFAATFIQGDLPLKPRLSTIVLTCVDARVDPSAFVRLRLGDALTMRTVGGRVTDTAMLEVALLWQLMKMGSGGVDPSLGLAIIHHTNCGMAKFADPDVAREITDLFGTIDVVTTYAIAHSHEALATDVRRATGSAHAPAGLSVSGHLYDVTTGTLEQVVDPSVV